MSTTVAALALTLAGTARAADPWEDEAAWRAAAASRATDTVKVLDAGAHGPWVQPGDAHSGALLRGGVDLRVATGTGVPWNAGGLPAAEVLRVDLRPELLATAGPWVAWGRPDLGGGVAGGAQPPPPQELWLGANPRLGARSQATVGFGKRDRWLGPGRFGALARSTNATPPWMGELAFEHDSPRVGALRAETDVGWMDRPRRDVQRPGLLTMDARWVPVPWLEVGATRMSLFAGEGRPAVDVLQLLVPTEPHVYDDPDRLLPDQDELAVLDLRVGLPAQLRPRGVAWAEAWTQYGGEDVIGKSLGPVPYPSLAGIANLGGAELAVRGRGEQLWIATVEGARLMDDTFRWYVGHRVYHDGFTQDDRVLGHFGGPDSATLDGSLAWAGERARVRMRAGATRRVGVIEARNGKVFSFLSEERRVRGGVEADGWRAGPRGTTLRVAGGALVERLTNADFVPGATVWAPQVWLTLGVQAPTLRARPTARDTR